MLSAAGTPRPVRNWLFAIVGAAAIIAVGVVTMVGVYEWAETDVPQAWIAYQTIPFVIPAIATGLRLLEAWGALTATGVAVGVTGGLHWWIFNDASSTAVLALIFIPLLAAIPVFIAVALSAEARLDG